MSFCQGTKHNSWLFPIVAMVLNRSVVISLMIRGQQPDRVAQSEARLTQEPKVPGSIPYPATYFRLSLR